MLREIAKAYDGPNGVRLREEQERRLVEHARVKGLDEKDLRRALELHVESMGRTSRGVLASVMLDRLAVFLVMAPLLTLVAAFRLSLGGWTMPVIVGLLFVWAVLHVVLSRGRPAVDAGAVMSARAGDLAKLFPSSFIVMGHTHVPTTKSVGEADYINLGSWAEEEPEPDEEAAHVYRAARTHLVVHTKDNRHEAHLYEWCSGVGPVIRETLARPLVTG
jgi:hypothetical protein